MVVKVDEFNHCRRCRVLEAECGVHGVGLRGVFVYVEGGEKGENIGLHNCDCYFKCCVTCFDG